MLFRNTVLFSQFSSKKTPAANLNVAEASHNFLVFLYFFQKKKTKNTKHDNTKPSKGEITTRFKDQ